MDVELTIKIRTKPGLGWETLPRWAKIAIITGGLKIVGLTGLSAFQFMGLGG